MLMRLLLLCLVLLQPTLARGEVLRFPLNQPIEEAQAVACYALEDATTVARAYVAPDFAVVEPAIRKLAGDGKCGRIDGAKVVYLRLRFIERSERGLVTVYQAVVLPGVAVFVPLMDELHEGYIEVPNVRL